MIIVKENFKSLHTSNMLCNLCPLFIDTQRHLFECPVIRKTKHVINFKEIFMIYFVGTTESQGKIAKKYQNNFEIKS